MEQCAPLGTAGASLAPLDISLEDCADASQAVSQVRAAIAGLAQDYGRVDGVLFVPPVPAGIMVAAPENTGCAPAADGMGNPLQAALEAAQPHGLRFVGTCSVFAPHAENCIFDAPLDKILAAASARGLVVRGIRMVQARIAYINADLDYKLAQLEWMSLSNSLAQRFLGLPAKEVL